MELSREPFANEARDNVAVGVVIIEVLGACSHVSAHVRGHPNTHLQADVCDDFLLDLWQAPENVDDTLVFLEKTRLVPLSNVPQNQALEIRKRTWRGCGMQSVERAQGTPLSLLPLFLQGLCRLGTLACASDDLVELAELRLVFDGVERTKHQVEDADGQADFVRQLPNHCRETARDLSQQLIAKGDVSAELGTGPRRSRDWPGTQGAKLQPDDSQKLRRLKEEPENL
mmetsp:Transcript_8235/g.22809  ORF Transcript_8235/g.22809 Transcript_8235/m.22809 type:complete len:228 (+) Transcript_8235:1040-1723(+)